MRNAEYWAERALNEMLMGERSVLEYENALLDAYRVALREIRKDIDAFFSRYARENKVTYQEARRRLVSSEMKEFQAVVDRWIAYAKEQGWDSTYIGYLEKLRTAKYISRLEMLEADVRYQIEYLEHNKIKDVRELLDINYLASYYVRYHDMAVGAEIAVRFDTIDPKGVARVVAQRWDENNFSGRIWNDRTRLIKSMQTILPQSFSRGLNANQLGDMIAKEMKVSENRGRTLARTEVNRICNQADLDVYKTSGIEKYDYLATLDMRTSEICRSLDGTVHEVRLAQIGVNFPPMHPNCRSTTVPHYDDLPDLGRAAKDADGKTIKVSRKTSQEEWIKTYVPEDQQERLLTFTKKFYKTEK